MTDYTTKHISEARVRTIVSYADWPEVREYTVTDNEELSRLLADMRDPQHAEWVFDVEAEFESN